MADTLRKLNKSFSLKISFQSYCSRLRSSNLNSPRSSAFPRPHSSGSPCAPSSVFNSGFGSGSFSFQTSQSSTSSKEDEVSSGRSSLKTYIVHVNRPECIESEEDVEKWHRYFLPSSEDQRRIHSFSYKNAINSFAVRLTEEEVGIMEKKNGFLLAYTEEGGLRRHTSSICEFGKKS